MDHPHYLASLFDPQSVVLVVEREAPPVWARKIEEALIGASCRTAVVRLPDHGRLPSPGFDLAVIVIGAALAGSAIEIAAALRCRAAVLMTEQSDPVQVRIWVDQARRTGIRLLGPATMGFVRPASGLDAGRMGPMPAAGNVALVSQSGVLGGAILDWSAETALGFSLAVSLGAEADVDISEVLDFLASDVRTRSVVVYLESIRDTRAFMSALRALASVKPVVVLKGQRSGRAQSGARTHAAAICGSDAIYAAALRRAGAVQIRLFTQMFTVARILAARTAPLGSRLAVVSNGNSPAVLVADLAELEGLELPDFAEATADRLALEHPVSGAANPVNLGLGAPPGAFEAAIDAVAADPAVDGVLVMLAPHDGVDVTGITEATIRAAKRTRTQVFACWMGERTVRPAWKSLDDAGVPVFRLPESAVDAYATVAAFHQNQRLLQQTPRPLSGLETPDLEGARMLIDGVIAERREVLTEMESKALLGAFHIPVVRTTAARSATEAIVVAQQEGFPVVMKVNSVDIAHRSEVGGVALNLRNAAEVRMQFGEILATVRRARPEARLDGVTLQRMHRSPRGRELYVGVFRDPLFGPVIAFGAGGTQVEVTRDTTIEFPPLNRFLAQRMIARTRIAELLRAPAVDLEPLEALLVHVSELVCELPWITEMDINPVIADEQGVMTVDARVVIDPSVGRRPVPHAHLAIMPYPVHLGGTQTAPDGRHYTIRAIQPEDGDLLQDFIRDLSPESRYFRFISAMMELPPKMIVRYTQIDYDREVALVAVAEDDGQNGSGNRIVGVVRYLRNPDGETCEFAVAIADAWQGARLGSTLMRAIIAAARAKGLRRIEGFVLSTNAKMLSLMIHLGFQVATDPEDPTMKTVTMDLSPEEHIDVHA